MKLFQRSQGTRLRRVTYALVSILSILFLLALALRPGEAIAFDSESIADFSDGWMLLKDDGTREPLSLPAQVETSGRVRIVKTIPTDVPYPSVLLFRTAHQQVHLYCNGESLYSFGGGDPPMFGRSPGSAWNLVRLPKDSAGQMLELELSSPYRTYQGQVQSVFIGSKAALLFFILRESVLSLLLTTAIFVAASVMLLIHFLLLRKVSGVGQETLYLGLFSLFISFWLFGEGRVTQFFGISPAFNTGFTILSMLATPIPLMHYVACRRSARFKHLMVGAADMLTIVLAICLGAQVFGLVDLIPQLPVIHLCFGVAAVILLYAVVRDTAQRPSKDARRLLLSLGVLALCFLLETIRLYMGIRPVGGMMRLGVLTFIAIQAVTAFQNASHIMVMSRFASLDALTGIQNRAAYHQWLTEVAKEDRIGVIIADVDDLKLINDTYGHEVGDDAIIRCSRCFSEAFSHSGKCFRIGGDEFAMVGHDLTPERLVMLGEAFSALGLVHGKETEYPFSVSWGHAVFQPELDDSISDTIKRADALMYERKHQVKEKGRPRSDPE